MYSHCIYSHLFSTLFLMRVIILFKVTNLMAGKYVLIWLLFRIINEVEVISFQNFFFINS